MDPSRPCSSPGPELGTPADSVTLRDQNYGSQQTLQLSRTKAEPSTFQVSVTRMNLSSEQPCFFPITMTLVLFIIAHANMANMGLSLSLSLFSLSLSPTHTHTHTHTLLHSTSSIITHSKTFQFAVTARNRTACNPCCRTFVI